jgi:hypothetical protein
VKSSRSRNIIVEAREIRHFIAFSEQQTKISLLLAVTSLLTLSRGSTCLPAPRLSFGTRHFAMGGKNFYAVKKGKKTGIFLSCEWNGPESSPTKAIPDIVVRMALIFLHWPLSKPKVLGLNDHVSCMQGRNANHT